ARGRERLKLRLVRRGLAPAAGLAAVTFAAESVAGAVPSALSTATLRAAGTLAAGRGILAGLVSPTGAELMKGALQGMAISHRKLIVWGLVLLGVAAAGGSALAPRAAGDDPDRPPRELAKVVLPSYVVEPPDLLKVEVHEGLPGRPVSG